GYARPTSPNLDRIAQQGVAFDNAFSTAPWSFPSHASLLTGLYPHEHGGEELFYRSKWLTIGEVLMARGYRTGAFSANKTFFARGVGLGRGFLHFEDYSPSLSDMLWLTPYGRVFHDRVLRPLGEQEPWTRKRAPDVN